MTVGSALPILVFPMIGDACIPSQNIPNTTAVRKAKEMMAASTLSLVRSSINASYAGCSTGFGCELPRPSLSNLSGVASACQQNLMLHCNN
jgi:hypothetical protein